jgi:peptide/nickel transport system substrate-binding protein
MRTIRRRSLLAGAAAAPLLTASRQAGADEPKHGGTLVATWGGNEPQALFVPAGGGSSPFFTSTKIMERLVRMEADLSFTPMLATAVKAAPDYKSYTISLRPNVRWHDGQNFTADDVVFSIQSVWKPLSGGIALKALSGVEAKDDHTVIVSFSQPLPEFTFLSLLASETGAVLARHVWGNGDIVTNPANNKPVGTGPWKPKEWVRGSHVEYERNADYWRPGLPYLDRLVIRWWTEPAARSAALEAGELHVAVSNAIPAPEMKRLSATGKFVVERKGYENYEGTQVLMFNTQSPIFGKRAVRQALLHAVDRDFIGDTIYFGLAQPAVSPIHHANAMFFSDDVPKYPFDPDLAGKLLDEAGYPLKGGKRFTASVVSAGWYAENIKTGPYLKQAFNDVGIDVNLSVPDRPTSLKRLYTDYDFDIAVSNWGSPIEPVPTITLNYTTDGIAKGVAFRNASRFSDPRMDEVVAKMTVEIDPAKRKQLVTDFARLACTEAPILPLVDVTVATVANSRVRNITVGANMMGESWGELWLAG